MARKSTKSRKFKSITQSSNAETKRSRRDVLILGRNIAVGVVAVGGVGYWARSSFAAHAAEHDLSRIGKGKPAVVQIHDPTCPTCTALQKETRQAMEQFGECDMLYLVADIKQPEGSAFAARHGVPHVTLLLFDEGGELQDTLRGMRQSPELEARFARHFRDRPPSV